jgi:hypothetical protein
MMITNQLIPPISNSDNPLFKEVAAGRSLPPLLTQKRKNSPQTFAPFNICSYICRRKSLNTSLDMEERKFKNRREQADYYAKLRGWGPLTEEDKAAIDDAVRMVTNLDSKPQIGLFS